MSHKRVELLANIAIVVIAILLGFVLVKRYLPSPNPKSEAVESVAFKELDLATVFLILLINTVSHTSDSPKPKRGR